MSKIYSIISDSFRGLCNTIFVTKQQYGVRRITMLVYSVYDNTKNPDSTVLNALTALEAISCVRNILIDRIKDIGVPTPSTESQYNDLREDLNYTDMNMFEHLIISFTDTTPNGYVSVVAREI